MTYKYFEDSSSAKLSECSEQVSSGEQRYRKIVAIIRGWIGWSGVRTRGGSSNYNSGVNTK